MLVTQISKAIAKADTAAFKAVMDIMEDEPDQPTESALTIPQLTDYLFESAWMNDREFILPVIQEVEEFLLSDNKVLLLSMPQGRGNHSLQTS